MVCAVAASSPGSSASKALGSRASRRYTRADVERVCAFAALRSSRIGRRRALELLDAIEAAQEAALEPMTRSEWFENLSA